MDSPLIFKYLFVKISLMARRGNKAIRATVSMKIALSEPLLALVNNYVKAIRFALFWLKENVKNPEEKGVLGRVHEQLYEKKSMIFHQRSLRTATVMPSQYTRVGTTILEKGVSREYTSQQFG